MSEKVVEEELVKSGEQLIRISLRRSPIGHTLSVWAHPVIEKYFASMSSGVSAVTEYGRNWVKRKNTPALEAYTFDRSSPQQLAIMESPSGPVSLSSIGEPLLFNEYGEDRPGRGREVINLSFIRLVGISEADGRSFDFRFVGTDEALQALAKKLRDAAKTFYLSYLKPVDVTVSVTIQKTIGG